MDKVIATKEIYSSEDYSKFTPMKGQDGGRTTRNGASLTAQIAKTKGNILPIIVTKNFEVVDGNSRLEACKTTESPVAYEFIAEGRDALETMKLINTTASKWTPDNYLVFYAEGYGYESYIDLLAFKNKHNIPLKYIFKCTQMVNSNSLKHGEFVESLNSREKKIIQRSALALERVLEVKKFAKEAYVIGALSEMYRYGADFELGTLLAKLGAYGETVAHKKMGGLSDSSVKYYLHLFDTCYNNNITKANRVNLYDANEWK